MSKSNPYQIERLSGQLDYPNQDITKNDRRILQIGMLCDEGLAYRAAEAVNTIQVFTTFALAQRIMENTGYPLSDRGIEKDEAKVAYAQGFESLKVIHALMTAEGGQRVLLSKPTINLEAELPTTNMYMEAMLNDRSRFRKANKQSLKGILNVGKEQGEAPKLLLARELGAVVALGALSNRKEFILN